MINIPIIQIVGYSGSGKTTFIKKLVEKFSSDGVNVATVKHDVHGLLIDKEGKDSYEFSKAGAMISAVSSSDMSVYKVHKKLSLLDILIDISRINSLDDADRKKIISSEVSTADCKNLDLIIIEGYSSLIETSEYADIKKIFNDILLIGISRKDNNKGFKPFTGSASVRPYDCISRKDNNKNFNPVGANAFSDIGENAFSGVGANACGAQPDISRKDNNKNFKGDIKNFDILITDENIDSVAKPIFSLDDIDGVKNMIYSFMNK